MKIGIITLIGNNYGNRLQNYAVHELLSEYGDVFTVRYEKKTPISTKTRTLNRYTPAHMKKAVDSRLLNVYHLGSQNVGTAGRLFYFLKHKNQIKAAMTERNQAFREFDEKYINYESELLHLSGDDDTEWVRSYDAWVCGSDQIWNPKYPTATRNAFLQFARKEKRISLSASIGLSDTSDMLPEYPEWINGIKYLSVREERAAEIVKELTGRNAEVFLDPTMLIPLSKWEAMADQAKATLPDRYAVGYFLGERKKSYINFIEKQTKSMAYVDLLNGAESQYMVFGPDDVIAAIRNANMVFVDSFHGAVFSILFHKQFVVFERSEEGKTMNSRLKTLLKRFGMENRIYGCDNAEELMKPIDYTTVDEIISSERERVHEFLESAMREIGNLPKETIEICKHIKISRLENCCGCTACAQACPKHCITLQQSREGFVYPAVDETSCVDCGKCKLVCPVLHHDEGNKPITILAEKNKDERIRKTSSSGGVFYELAKAFIHDGGVVYGCALDDNMVARHIRVDAEQELVKLQSSKYVQSDMGQTMHDIKKLLDSGESVMFSGTPCQTAGLRNYLQKDYQNLFVIDVLCHGVPSPKLFADYLEILGEKFGGKPVSVNFRNKQRGWKRLYMEVCFDNGKRHYIYSGYDRYEGMFLNNISLRPSCYECKFTSAFRYGDITLGDFWGIGKIHPEWDDDRGISVVMLNTPKGITAYEQIADKFEGREEAFDTVKAGQRTLYAPTPKNPKHDAFYKSYVENGCRAAMNEFTSVPSMPVRAYYAVMRWTLDKIRKIRKIGY